MSIAELSLKLFRSQKYFKIYDAVGSMISNRRYTIPTGTPGEGAGRGGGAGGSVREGGGGLGKFGAAQEESYFYNKQKEQLRKIKRKEGEEEAPKKDD